MCGTDGRGDEEDRGEGEGEIERKTYFEDKVHVPSGN